MLSSAQHTDDYHITCLVSWRTSTSLLAGGGGVNGTDDVDPCICCVLGLGGGRGVCGTDDDVEVLCRTCRIE